MIKEEDVLTALDKPVQFIHCSSGSIPVVDRETDSFGPMTQTWNISGNRGYRIETLCTLPDIDGRGEVGAFCSVDLNPPDAPNTPVSFSMGGQFRVDF